MKLSVVMPVLDEAARITTRLDELSRQPDVCEIVVADGGSSDDTAHRVDEHALTAAGVACRIDAPRGRARQMNAGAAAAKGDVLLFLHADVSLPPQAARIVERTLADPRVVAGAFRTHHVDDRPGAGRAPWLRLADVRSRYSRLPYGDQALFVRRAAFQRVGGFPDQPLMEDVEIARRLWRVGRVVIAKESARVSGRRFLAHPLRDTLLVNAFPLLYRLGVSPARLARLYRNVR